MRMMKRKVEITLNRKWIKAVRFASLFAPIEASAAVIQVPMFMPKIRYNELSMEIAPVIDSDCRIPIEALELWMSAVKSAPNNTPISGLVKVDMIS